MSNDALAKSCAIVFGNEYQGTGYLLTPTLLVTCHHVVRDLKPGAAVELKFAQDRDLRSKTFVASYLKGDPKVDWALLRLRENVEGTLALSLAGTPAISGSEFYSFAAPADARETLIKFSGRVSMTDTIDPVNAPAMQLDCSRAALGNMEGASGAPVIADGLVIGHFKRVIPRDGTSAAAYGMLYACPISSVIAALDATDKQQVRIGIGASAEARQRRWKDWQSAALQRVLGFSIKASSVPAPLEQHWSAFANRTPWLVKVKELTREISSIAERLLPRSAKTLLGIDYEIPHDQVRRELQRCIEQLLDALDHRRSAKTAALFEQLDHKISELEPRLQTPHYARCFPVVGTYGSGKSHFLHTLAKAARDGRNGPQWFVLPLHASSFDGRLSDCLAAAITDALGLTLEKLNEQCCRENTRVLITVDDLHHLPSPNGARELTECIELWTKYGSFYWAFFIQDTAFDRVVCKHEFWIRYGFRSLASTLSVGGRDSDREDSPELSTGWLGLDTLNVRERLGIKILKAERPGERLAVEEIEESQGAHFSKDWYSPLIAWILLDLTCATPHTETGIGSVFDLSHLVTLNYLEIIEKYWDRMTEKSIMDGAGQARLDACIRTVADYAIRTQSWRWTEFRFEADTTNEISGQQLSELVNLGVLNSFTVNASDPGRSCRYIELTNDLFWYWLLSSRLLANGSLDGIISWMQSGVPEQHREGVTQFVLLRADRDSARDNTDREFCDTLWQSVMRNGELPCALGLFSALRASSERRRWVLETVRDMHREQQRGDAQTKDQSATPAKQLSHRDLFALLYFVGSCDEIDCCSKLELLKPWYKALGEADLGAYYIYEIAPAIRGINDRTTLIRACELLSGCHTMQVASKLAQVVWRHSLKLTGANADLLCSDLHDFLKTQRTAASQEYQEARACGQDPARLFFRQHLIGCFLAWHVEKTGLDAYDDFVRWKFYDGEDTRWLSPLLRQELEVIANQSLGNWYRRKSERNDCPDEIHDRYSELVTNLLCTSEQQLRERAFFLLRHTGDIDEDNKSWLAKRFRDLYVRMGRTRALKVTWDEHPLALYTTQKTRGKAKRPSLARRRE